MKRLEVVGAILMAALFAMPMPALAVRAHPWGNVSKKMYDCKRALMEVADQGEVAKDRMQRKIDKLDAYNEKKKRAGQRVATTKSEKKATLKAINQAVGDLEAAIKDYKSKCNLAKKMVKKGIGFGD